MGTRSKLVVIVLFVLVLIPNLSFQIFPDHPPCTEGPGPEYDVFSSILLDGSGDTLILGNITLVDKVDISYGSPLVSGYLIERFDSAGDLEQNISIYVDGYPVGMAVDGDDNVILVFRLEGATTFEGRDISGSGGMLVKISPNGVLLLVESFPANPSDLVVEDGKVYIIGTAKYLKYNATDVIGNASELSHLAIYAYNTTGDIVEFIQISGSYVISNSRMVVGEDRLFVYARTSRGTMLGDVYLEGGVRILFSLTSSRMVGWLQQLGTDEVTGMVLSDISPVVMSYNLEGNQTMVYMYRDGGNETLYSAMGRGTALLESDGDIYFMLGHEVRSTSIGVVYTSDRLSDLIDYAILGSRLVVLGQTSDPEFLETSSYQDHIRGESDIVILSYELNGDVGNRLWGTYLGWFPSTVLSCLN